MPDREEARKQYSKTRAEFEKLETQDKTAFVVEATFATLGQAVEDTGRQFADILERVANMNFGREHDPDAPNPAAPPSAKKKTAKKRTTTRRKKKDEDDA
ncbi:MAG: hypothetical protein AAGI91_15990 [Bacteroidota bacterium]